MTSHVHGYGCPETEHHAAETPIYDHTAWDFNLAPMRTVEQLRAEYDRQVAAKLAAGGTA